jgi:hypothetical protein
VPFADNQYFLSGGKDWFTIDLKLNLAVILKAGTADKILIRIRDDIRDNVKQYMYAKAAGVKV